MNQHVLDRAENVGASDQVLVEGAAPRTSARHRQRSVRGLLVPILLQLGAMLGIGALLYPSAADWFSTLGHNAEVSGYVREVEAMPAADREAKLEIARQYNSFMPQGVLRDPYAPGAKDEGPRGDSADSAYRAYEQVLSVSDSGVIGEINYPKLGIGLPVSHGTSNEVISNGVGHLYGSSLPVGGPSTHSVLTSHSGMVHASLFTPLTQAKIGESFTVTVLGETHYYRVDQIETVLPEQTGSLRVVGGKDYVTLITCTPIGINSHRLLVRGERIPALTTGDGQTIIDGDGKTAGFPWWAVGFIGGSGMVAYLLFAPQRPRRRAKNSPSNDDDQKNQNQEVPA